MARLTRWAQKLFTYSASKDGSEQTMIRPAGPPPRAVHERHWQQEERRRPNRDGGAILVVLLGSPGIGRKSLHYKACLTLSSCS